MNKNDILLKLSTSYYKLSKTSTVFYVEKEHVDGRHELADGIGSYEEAKTFVEKREPGGTWIGDMRYISTDGGVISIEARPDKLSNIGEKVWDAVNYAWTTDADELYIESRFSNDDTVDRDGNKGGIYIVPPSKESEFGVEWEGYLWHQLGDLSRDEIASGLNELEEKGFITAQKPSDSWKRKEQAVRAAFERKFMGE